MAPAGASKPFRVSNMPLSIIWRDAPGFKTMSTFDKVPPSIISTPPGSTITKHAHHTIVVAVGAVAGNAPHTIVVAGDGRVGTGHTLNADVVAA